MKYLILLLFPLICNAADIEISLGATQFIKPDNGIWWQAGPASDGFTDSFHLLTPSVTIGATDHFYPTYKWHFGYAHLGNPFSYSTATRSDEEYAGNGCRLHPCPALGQWYGSGAVQGIYGTVSREWNIDGITYALEGGLWLYHATFQMRVQGGTMGGSPKEDEYISREAWEVGPVIGASVGNGKTDVVWRMYKVDMRDDPTITPGYAQNISIRWRF